MMAKSFRFYEFFPNNPKYHDVVSTEEYPFQVRSADEQPTDESTDPPKDDE